jgi:hypothetical protein
MPIARSSRPPQLWKLHAKARGELCARSGRNSRQLLSAPANGKRFRSRHIPTSRAIAPLALIADPRVLVEGHAHPLLLAPDDATRNLRASRRKKRSKRSGILVVVSSLLFSQAL